MRNKYLAISVVLALLLVAAGLLWSVSTARAQRAELTVCPLGPPDCDYDHPQAAVDAANDGDTIKVATGVYTGVQARPFPVGYLNPPASGLIDQVVYLSKTLTIQGGYTTADWNAPDPVANPTTIDAEGDGRAVVIAGDISPHIEGLRFTGGNASGLGGYSGVNWPDHDTGGGICVVGATATISNNVIVGNTAGSYGSGGGLYLFDDDSTLIHNEILTNTANTLYGGGIYTMFSPALMAGNRFSGNTAGWGGAVFLEFSPATLIGNDLMGNVCAMAGGALNVHTSDATIDGNLVAGNRATQAGGAMRLYDSAATVRYNVFADNRTPGYGGAIHLWSSPSTLDGNLIVDNRAGNVTDSTGGAMEFWFSNATLINNVIADNQAGDVGTALYIASSNPRFLHNTIAQNLGVGGSDGSAIFVDNYSTALFTNTILVSHSLGINGASGSAALLEATLWGNDTDWTGLATIVTGSRNYWGDPAFVAPTVGDYHIGWLSMAHDRGIEAGVALDVDGETRPVGLGYDIGADEFYGPSLVVAKEADHDPAAAGEPLTYTLYLSNTGTVDLTATLTDRLPAQVTPGGWLAWTPAPIPPGGAWSTTLVVTVEAGYVGPLTNSLQVTTQQGIGRIYEHVLAAEEPIAGLRAGNDGPTPFGAPTTLTATLSAGSHVHFDWTFGDGQLGSGAVVSHTYPEARIYTATVAAVNPHGQVEATTAVNIIAPYYRLYLPLVMRTPQHPLPQVFEKNKKS